MISIFEFCVLLRFEFRVHLGFQLLNPVSSYDFNR